MIEKIEGIIIREKDYSETSKIIDVISKEHGLISIIARGSKSIKSQFYSSTSKLTYGYFHIYYKKDKLASLNGVDVINSFSNIKKDYEKIVYVSYIISLVNQTISNNKSDIFKIMVSSIIKINDEFDPLVLVNIVELKLLSYLGILPVLDECVVCGNVTNICTISVEKGGFVCSKCRSVEKIISSKSIKYLRMFYYLDISKISKIDVDDNTKKEIDFFITMYYEKYSGLYLINKRLVQI